MSSPELVRQILAFGVVGVLATGVHYGVALTLIEQAAVDIYLANILGYGSAVLVSLIGHSRLTFRIPLNNTIVRRFVLVSLTALLSSEVMLAFLQNAFPFHHRIALAIVVITIPLITFVINKVWVYVEHSSH